MQIDLGKIFSWLFKGKKKDDKTNKNISWQPITADAVLNCCEQIGVFEDHNIEDENSINKICEDVANLFNSGEKSEVTLKNAFVQGFNKSSYNVNNREADLFVNSYIESYVYGEE